ncbi:hypothetical protein [Calothrix sp. 336/3]|uniref:hypothetical protein n=1 Tax=Calothrix sp. 336/3 TaxID=1337936 RepID=UPI00191C677F|nr:hypothetical protein [Calothrix sp. 336/3]
MAYTRSKVTGEYLKSRGVDGEKIQVIPNGVDTDIFHYYPSFVTTRREKYYLYSEN